jgi:rare lipoprotein A
MVSGKWEPVYRKRLPLASVRDPQSRIAGAAVPRALGRSGARGHRLLRRGTKQSIPSPQLTNAVPRNAKRLNGRGKDSVLKHPSNPQCRRVLRNTLMTTALAAIIASGASIHPTSAHAHYGQTRGKQSDHSSRGHAISGHNRHGVRDKLFTTYNPFNKQTDRSVETGRSFNYSGIASVYSGQRTASGEAMHSGDMTAAHRTLPFGTKVTVVNHNNGRSAVVRINDRGPFVRGRVIDLSPAAGRALGVDGLALVSLSR